MNSSQANKKMNSIIEVIEKELSLYHFWTPPVPLWKPFHSKSNSRLRIAFIGSERLYQGFRYECKLLLLTPKNWRNILQFGNPDMLLIESYWSKSTGHWYLAQSLSGGEQEELISLISFAKKMGVPTTYWNTHDIQYHSHFNGFSRNFDYVFCADPKEADKLLDESIDAEVLLPAVQPALFNPFRIYKHTNAFSLNILFDGIYDLIQLRDELSILEQVKKYGLAIIDSRNMLTKKELEEIRQYKDHILGSVTYKGLLTALKYSKAYLTFGQTLLSKIQQQWMSLEASACCVPVIHNKSLSNDDFRRNFVLERPEPIDMLTELVRFQEDELYRRRRAHKIWRTVHQNHTFSHRLKTVCNKIGLPNGYNESPMVTIICITDQPDTLEECLKIYKHQNYPNKSLIVILSGENDTGISNDISAVFENQNDIRLYIIPKENVAGTSMNFGYMAADGPYCFRMDHTCYYGADYISDIMLHLKSVSADAYIKPHTYFHTLEDDSVSTKRSKVEPYCISSIKKGNAGGYWAKEKPAGGKKELLINSKSVNLRYFDDDITIKDVVNNQDSVVISTDPFNYEQGKRMDSNIRKEDGRTNKEI